MVRRTRDLFEPTAAVEKLNPLFRYVDRSFVRESGPELDRTHPAPDVDLADQEFVYGLDNALRPKQPVAADLGDVLYGNVHTAKFNRIGADRGFAAWANPDLFGPETTAGVDANDG